MLSAEKIGKIGKLLNGGATAASIKKAIAEIEGELDAHRLELDEIPARRDGAALKDNAEKEIGLLRDREQVLYDSLEVGEARLSKLRERLNELTAAESKTDPIEHGKTIGESDHLAFLSPARRALAEHLMTVARADADFAKANRPAERLREQLQIATGQLAAAEADLAEIDAKHAEQIRDQAKTGGEIALTKPPQSAKAEAAIDIARRTCNAVRAALVECETEANAAAVVLRAAQSRSDALVMAVMLEEHGAALERHARACSDFVAAEADCFAIAAAMGAHGCRREAATPGSGISWLQAVYALRESFAKQRVAESTPAEVRARQAQWITALARMAVNATATANG